MSSTKKLPHADRLSKNEIDVAARKEIIEYKPASKIRIKEEAPLG
jgi:hypothetical protein